MSKKTHIAKNGKIHFNKPSMFILENGNYVFKIKLSLLPLNIDVL